MADLRIQDLERRVKAQPSDQTLRLQLAQLHLRADNLNEAYLHLWNAKAAQPEPRVESSLLDVNHATEAALKTLHGVGPQRAAAIVDNRPYETVDDLIFVLGKKLLERLRPDLCAGSLESYQLPQRLADAQRPALRRLADTWLSNVGVSRHSEEPLSWHPISQHFEPPPRLPVLALAWCRFEGPGQVLDLEPLKDLGTLREVSLKSCRLLQEADLVHLGHVTNLEILDLEGTAIDGSSLVHLAGLPLQTLRLARTRLAAGNLSAVGPLPTLRDLDVSGCAGLRAEHLKALACTHVERLMLGKTELAEEDIQALQPLLTRVIELDLQGTGVSDRTLAHLALPSLSALSIRNTAVTGRGLAGHSELRRLDLRFCEEVRDLSFLSALPRLRELDLMNVPITAADLDHVAKLPDLRKLVLFGCRLPSVAALGHAPRLEWIDLRYSSVEDADQLRRALPHAEILTG